MKCTKCDGDLIQIDANRYVCNKCHLTYSTNNKKTDYTELLFVLTDYNIYKTLMLITINFILLECILLFTRITFDLNTLVNSVDFVVSIVSVMFFYFLGYKLAIYKITHKE